ncbi:MAG: phosphoribosylglycinamide formyltransferase [Flavobacteriales bacterium]|nr:phosphoribosylglycinamide formyltransferase [Flavobacteriales bacterium]
MVRIAILASGSGTNAQKLMEHFALCAWAEVALVACDRPQAGVVQRAWNMGVPCYLFGPEELRDGTLDEELRTASIDLLVLAGFLRLLPSGLVQAWPERILNIHPSLLPKFGGKGMYGDRVHQAVLASGEPESGITVHLVNERYDEGRQLAQFSCPVLPGDDVDTLAARIHALEHAHFPQVVETYARSFMPNGTAR